MVTDKFSNENYSNRIRFGQDKNGRFVSINRSTSRRPGAGWMVLDHDEFLGMHSRQLFLDLLTEHDIADAYEHFAGTHKH